MCKLTAVLACAIGLLALVSVKSGYNATAEYVGQMPEVMVTAEYEYPGLMDTVVVTAARNDDADVAWSGLLDTVTVVGPSLGQPRGSTIPILTYRSPLGIMIDNFHHRVE